MVVEILDAALKDGSCYKVDHSHHRGLLIYAGHIWLSLQNALQTFLVPPLISPLLFPPLPCHVTVKKA